MARKFFPPMEKKWRAFLFTGETHVRWHSLDMLSQRFRIFDNNFIKIKNQVDWTQTTQHNSEQIMVLVNHPDAPVPATRVSC